MFLDILPAEPIREFPTIETTVKTTGGGSGATSQISKVAPTTFIIAFLVIVAVVVIANVTRVINRELKNA